MLAVASAARGHAEPIFVDLRRLLDSSVCRRANYHEREHGASVQLARRRSRQDGRKARVVDSTTQFVLLPRLFALEDAIFQIRMEFAVYSQLYH